MKQVIESEVRLVGVPGAKPINKWMDSVAIASVGPDGNFAVTFFDKVLLKRGHDIRQGQTPVVVSEGRAFVPGWATAQGWVLYSDLCKGQVRGVEASEKHWRLWLKIVKMFAKGRTPQVGALEQAIERAGIKGMYHPEVYARRELAKKGGHLSLDADQLAKWLGLDGSSDDDDEFDLSDDLDDDEDLGG